MSGRLRLLVFGVALITSPAGFANSKQSRRDFLPISVHNVWSRPTFRAFKSSLKGGLTWRSQAGGIANDRRRYPERLPQTFPHLNYFTSHEKAALTFTYPLSRIVVLHRYIPTSRFEHRRMTVA